MATSIGWLNALIGEVLFASWELLSNSHSTNCQISDLDLRMQGQKTPSVTARSFICMVSSAPVSSPPVCWIRNITAEIQLCQYWYSETCQQVL